MENKNLLIENLKTFVRINEEGKDKKSIGATIAKLVCNAYKENDIELIAFIEKEKEEKNPSFKAAKSYVSKGTKVGKAFQSGIFSSENTQEVSTLYDILLKEEKEKEETNKALSEKRANDNAALLAVYHSQGEVDKFILSSDPVTYAATLQQGYILLGEQEKQEEQEKLFKNMAKSVTETKAFIDLLYEQSPELFIEVMDYMLSKADNLKAA